MAGILWGIVAFLVIVWVLGFALQLVGNIIHVILLLAIALAIYNFAMSRDRRQ